MDINKKDRYGMTELHRAAWSKPIYVVRRLVESGADVNVKDNDGESPLHFAAWWGRVDIVEFLLKAGADPQSKANNGDTPAHCALCYGGEKGRSIVRMIASARESKDDTDISSTEDPLAQN